MSLLRIHQAVDELPLMIYHANSSRKAAAIQAISANSLMLQQKFMKGTLW
jgi:hypothetical protein